MSDMDGARIECRDNGQYLHVTMYGSSTKENILETARKIINECRRTDRREILVERVGEKDLIDMVTAYKLGAYYLPRLICNRFSKVAILETRISQKMMFFEKISMKTGHPIRFFSHTGSAEQWLMGENGIN